MSVPDRRSFFARLSSPDRFSSLPIVVSVGCRESCWIVRIIAQKPPGRAWQARKIAEGLAAECSCDPKDYRRLELAGFAVQQLAKMLREFKVLY